jgi:hypothetical protein
MTFDEAEIVHTMPAIAAIASGRREKVAGV